MGFLITWGRGLILSLLPQLHCVLCPVLLKPQFHLYSVIILWMIKLNHYFFHQIHYTSFIKHVYQNFQKTCYLSAIWTFKCEASSCCGFGGGGARWYQPLWLGIFLLTRFQFVFPSVASLIWSQVSFENLIRLEWWLFVMEVSLGLIASVLKPWPSMLFVYISIFTLGPWKDPVYNRALKEDSIGWPKFMWRHDRSLDMLHFILSVLIKVCLETGHWH